MSFKITATAPTVYQLKSLSAFGMPYKAVGNGSYYAEQEFDTEEEAKAYLENRAHNYADTEEELTELLKDIQYGALTLDAVTAHIEEVEVD